MVLSSLASQQATANLVQLSLSLPSHSFSATLFSLSSSSAGACSTKSLGSLAGISMNQSLLSSHIYEAVSEAKPQQLMRLMCVSSNASG